MKKQGKSPIERLVEQFGKLDDQQQAAFLKEIEPKDSYELPCAIASLFKGMMSNHHADFFYEIENYVDYLIIEMNQNFHDDEKTTILKKLYLGCTMSQFQDIEQQFLSNFQYNSIIYSRNEKENRIQKPYYHH